MQGESLQELLNQLDPVPSLYLLEKALCSGQILGGRKELVQVEGIMSGKKYIRNIFNIHVRF